jgi:hypothetical protein
MRKLAIGFTLMMTVVVAAGCGSSAPPSSTATTSRSATTQSGGKATSTTSGSGTASGGLTEAKFNATNACSTLTAAQMTALVGGPLSSSPTAHSGPGPIECTFGASINGVSSDGSIQIAYFAPTKGESPKTYIDGNEQGYHPQPESGLGDYAIFDPALKETQAAKGPIAVTVAGSPPGSTTAQVEAAQATAVNAIFQSLGV